MSILNRLFGTSESIARDAAHDDESILEHWKKYLETVPQKKAIIEHLRTDGDLQKNAAALKNLLTSELADISTDEKQEADLISDLEALAHEQKIKRIHKLEQCLRYVDTRYEYVFALLEHLFKILCAQMHLVEKLRAGSKNSERLREHLVQQSELESEIIAKISSIRTFHSLFLSLVKGEHVISQMGAEEKKLVKIMQERMHAIFSGEISEGITYEWAITVFNAIEDKFHEMIAQEIIEANHPDADYELVNRPQFIELVREVITEIRPKPVSQKMIAAFVHIFREWYNHEYVRDAPDA